ncbi:alpha/beta hydrolase family protein [Arsenicicoccus cauae]|uniref:alpha/beta hydrolase family protein n=1 Tax=Arsenicicoccus cauae TaxID=2663847 RepID=UPI00370D010D
MAPRGTSRFPAGWNGDLVLFSHGFRTGPANPTVDAGLAPTAAALQARGYAVAQSSYARTGWALGSAVHDQIGVLAEFRARVGEPRRTLAMGRSMGGLVSSLLAERRDAAIDGAISTCGRRQGRAGGLWRPAGSGLRAADGALHVHPCRERRRGAGDAGATRRRSVDPGRQAAAAAAGRRGIQPRRRGVRELSGGRVRQRPGRPRPLRPAPLA